MIKETSMMLRNCSIIALFLILPAGSAFSQEAISQEAPPPPAAPPPETVTRSFSYGVTGAYGIMLNGAQEFSLPTVPTCCPGYSSTTGGGFIGGAEFDLPLSSNLDLVGRLVYQTSSATFTTDEPTTVRIDNQPVETAFRHTLTTSTSFLMLEPMLDYRFGERGLSIFGGVRLGTAMSGTYDEQEAFADPSLPYDYPDGTAVRNASSGDIPNMSGFQMGLVFGARYRLPMNSDGTLSLVPEVSFSPMFTNVVTDASWTISPIRIGLSILIDVMKVQREATPLKP
ncbi:MAG: outer membrane beta-barrel protein [Ignavibacteria bacterium]|nr:outer membrane beta-barrel protein [Ignavibacteria bacterium]MBP6510626.1 outer membrane beta-barrel protein [Candidatus Kapabacteria bacterium]MBK6419123.1 outer membrane beta-barrel protein [Ignavibacteria bacterium]MBK6760187.1 outer membrane beta-barrel protein [Ignavibacteria bacterium]MBK7185351.1 outer membrane beta-barrel protein [Ignavibacteria bacterium]